MGGAVRGGDANAIVDDTIDRVEARGGPALFLTGGTATLLGGAFAGGDATSEGSYVDNLASSGDIAALTTDSILLVRGGTYSAGLAHAANGIYITGSTQATHLTILGGTFRGDMSLEIPYTDATPPAGSTFPGATVWIVGGDFDSGGDVDLRLAHPGVFTILIVKRRHHRERQSDHRTHADVGNDLGAALYGPRFRVDLRAGERRDPRRTGADGRPRAGAARLGRSCAEAPAQPRLRSIRPRAHAFRTSARARSL